jgi:site-specific recombinase XerD
MMNLSKARSEFVSGYFSTHRRTRKTQTAYSADLGQFHRFAGQDRALRSISATDIEEWAAHLRNGNYAPASIRRKIAALKVFCSYWVRKGALTQSPFLRVKLSFGRIEQLPRSLSESETRALLAETRKNYLSAIQSLGTKLPEDSNGRPRRAYRVLRNSALVDLLFATGVRVGEASGLDLTD